MNFLFIRSTQSSSLPICFLPMDNAGSAQAEPLQKAPHGVGVSVAAARGRNVTIVQMLGNLPVRLPGQRRHDGNLEQPAVGVVGSGKVLYALHDLLDARKRSGAIGLCR